MPVTVEAAHLLNEIRELRVRRRAQYETDLAEIERAFDAEIIGIRRSGARRGLVHLAIMAAAPAVAVGLVSLLIFVCR
jgi:hypothetical protein